jgi:hypothetical protein
VLTKFNEENSPIPQRTFLRSKIIFGLTWPERIIAIALSALLTVISFFCYWPRSIKNEHYLFCLGIMEEGPVEKEWLVMEER